MGFTYGGLKIFLQVVRLQKAGFRRSGGYIESSIEWRTEPIFSGCLDKSMGLCNILPNANSD